jgi:hypothetical protein
VTFKNIVTKDGKKGRKIPFDCNTLCSTTACSNDQKTWSSFEIAEILAQEKHMSGIGFVLEKKLGIYCIDVDDCISTDGSLNKTARYALEPFKFGTYCELSYNKTGIHVFGMGTLPEDELGGARGDIEVYDDGRFIAVTGWRMLQCSDDITENQWPLNVNLAQFPKKKKLTYIPQTTYKWLNSESITDKLGLRCSSIALPDDYTHKNGCCFQGSHPFHGSSTGANFVIDDRENVWYCFRHNVGGGALELFAMKEGIIDCEDCGRNAFYGKWPEVMKALENAGYDLEKSGISNPLIKQRVNLKHTLTSLGVGRNVKN